MKWVTDKSGRFVKRPHYDQAELDYECEQRIQQFLTQKYGQVTYPISTADLTILIEQSVDDLDMGADLTEEEGEVEGLTEFCRGQKPIVKISSRLVGNPIMENRLRTTLTHELSHVAFHTFLFEMEQKPPSLFGEIEAADSLSSLSNKCKRDSIIGAAEYDWMEWQAGYGCGAFLIPASALITTVKEFRQNNNLQLQALPLSSIEGQKLIETVAKTFQTSKDAARVRLLQKHILQDDGGRRISSLF